MGVGGQAGEALRRFRAMARGLILGVLGLAGFVGIWFGLSAKFGGTRVPSPANVVSEFFSTVTHSGEINIQGGGSNGFLPSVVATGRHYLVGTVGGIGVAVVLLYLCSRYRVAWLTLGPLINIVRTIPPLAIAPFLLLWFGTSSVAQSGLVAAYTFVMLFPPGLAAIDRTSWVLVQFARTLGASPGVISRKIVFPAMIPELTGPLRVAVSWSWGLVVVSELLGAPQGLGKLIGGFMSFTATGMVIVAIVWILIMAVVSEAVVSVIINYLTRWVPRASL